MLRVVLLVVGRCLFLVVGCWLLFIGCWVLLDWLLVVERSMAVVVVGCSLSG